MFGAGFMDSAKIQAVQMHQGESDTGNHEILIDQMELLSSKNSNKTPIQPRLKSLKAYERHVDITWESVDPKKVKYIKIYRSKNGEEYKPVGIQNTQYYSKYTDFTGETNQTYSYKISAVGQDYSESALSSAATATTKNMSDEELLSMVQEASFQYLLGRRGNQ